jgi:hypothetical protein
MNRDPLGRFRYVAMRWVTGSIALALARWVCLALDFNFTATALVYLIVPLALLDSSFISSNIYSNILNYLFAE